jgi:hypothetical protein
MNSLIKRKTFREYYQDPHFRERHLHYMSEKVKCKECGQMTSRCNMTKHRRTEIHNRLSEEKNMKDNKVTRDQLSLEIGLLQEYLDLLKEKIEKLDIKK